MKLIYTDDDIFLVDKPSGVHSVIGRDPQALSVAGQLVTLYPHLAHVAPQTNDSGLVNRLDFETSGLMIGAWDREIWEILHTRICAGLIEKEYLAIVEGELEAHRSIEGFLGSKSRSAKSVQVYQTMPKHGRALAARTEFSPRAIHEDLHLSLVRVTAHAARRHQVRAHAQAIGFPLLGDSVYGAGRTMAEVLPGNDRPPFFLQAARMSLKHPRTNQPLTVTLELPAWVKGVFNAANA